MSLAVVVGSIWAVGVVAEIALSFPQNKTFLFFLVFIDMILYKRSIVIQPNSVKSHK